MSLLKAKSVPVVLFGAFSATYFVLRSSNCFAVDGGYRCLEVYRRQTLFFHPNNHLLYPVNVLLWSRLLAAFGFRSSGPLEFLSSIEIMNCMAAAASLALFSWLLFRTTSSIWLSLGVPAGLGVTKAFLAQATNANEPMVAILWSLAAIALAVLAVEKGAMLPLVFSGVLFSLAMATYRSAVLLEPVAFVIIAYDGQLNSHRKLFERTRLLRIAVLVLSTFVGSASIFGWAYWRGGFTGPSAMARNFSTQYGSRAFLGLSIGKIVNIPIGLVRNIHPLVAHYDGIRGLLAGPKALLFLLVSVASVLGLFILGCCIWVANHWDGLLPSTRVGFLAASVGFASTMIPVAVWDPQYDKLWIQPYICLFFLIALAMKGLASRGRHLLLLSSIVVLVFLLGGVLNIKWAIHEHVREPYEFEEARRMAQFVGDQDIVVGEWDPASILYGTLWAGESQFLSFPSEAVINGRNVLGQLQKSVDRARSAGAKVFFIGILDMPKPTWDSFVGKRCGVEYHSIDVYRVAARSQARLKTDAGYATLWVVDPKDLAH